MIVGGKTGVLDENSFTARFFLLNTGKARSYGCSRNPLMTYTRHRGLLRPYEGTMVMKHPLTSHLSERNHMDPCIFHQPLSWNEPFNCGGSPQILQKLWVNDFFLNVFPGWGCQSQKKICQISQLSAGGSKLEPLWGRFSSWRKLMQILQEYLVGGF